MWSEGIANGFYYSIKYYDEPSSEFGLDSGRISKLMLWKDGAYGSREIAARYERGWCQLNDDVETTAALQILMDKYN